MSPCLALAVLAGYLVTLHPNRTHPSSFDAPYVELQSCQRGPGVYVMGAGSQLVAGGVQHGFWYEGRTWRVGIQPFVGGSYTPREVPELPAHAQFWVGANVLAASGPYSVGVKYGHASSAGLTRVNAGLDVLGFFVGYTFGG